MELSMSDVGGLSDVAAIGLGKTGEVLDCGEWYVRQLIKRGELESYLDSRTRKVTVRSIKARQERLLKAQTPAPTIPPAPHRSGQEAQAKLHPGLTPQFAQRAAPRSITQAPAHSNRGHPIKRPSAQGLLHEGPDISRISD
jgi:hypothetical protein